MSDIPQGAHIEIVDPKAWGGYALAPSKVLINGVDVGMVAEDGVHIDVGDSASFTQVTLTLLPARITFRGMEESAAFERWGSITDPEPPPPPR